MDLAANAVYLVAGAALLLAAVLPRFVAHKALSAPIAYVAVGAAVGAAAIPFPTVDPIAEVETTQRLTEICVIVSLMGVGLALDRRPSVRGWGSTWRLLGIAMPLCIAAAALLGWGLMGLAPASALLLGAVLAPTDPVLASDVQVGRPSDAEDEEDEVRFALTSEAGLNDGLAFPFVYAAIYLAAEGGLGGWVWGWAAWELVGKVIVGVGAGWAVGWVVGRVAFRASRRLLRLAVHGEAVVALAATFLAYGLGELVGGWGFLSVFVAALAIRDAERSSDYHQTLHSFTDEVERLLTLALLLMLGVALTSGLLGALTWRGVAAGLVFLLVVRPVAGWLAMRGSGVAPAQARAIGFFGVRGVGSFYYLAYGTSAAAFTGAEEVWATVTFTVLLSIVVHGVTATPWMDRLDARAGRREPAPHAP